MFMSILTEGEKKYFNLIGLDILIVLKYWREKIDQGLNNDIGNNL
jgi:hypothetical protein